MVPLGWPQQSVIVRDGIGTDDIQALRYNKSTIYIVDIAIAGRTTEAHNIDQASAGARHANTGFLNFVTSRARPQASY